MPFYFTGCDGNGNQFETREACEADCPPRLGKSLPVAFDLEVFVKISTDSYQNLQNKTCVCNLLWWASATITRSGGTSTLTVHAANLSTTEDAEEITITS